MTCLGRGLRLVTSRLAALALLIAIGGALALLGGSANAASLTSSKSAISQSDETVLTLVRDGCGRGMRWSNRRQDCVPQGGSVDPGAAIIQGIIGGVIGSGGGSRRGDGCPRGMRFSNSRQACVWR